MSTFGSIFRVTTYGESHCKSVGCIVDGCPPGMKVDLSYIQAQLSRRRPGQSNLTTPRNEFDQVEIHSGIEHGITLGTPILMQVKNKDQRPNDYSETEVYPRPSHADYTYLLKYGLKASSGGGRSSARETIGRVASGALAEYYLNSVYKTEIIAFVSSAGSAKMEFIEDLEANRIDDFDNKLELLINSLSREKVDEDITRCPETKTAQSIKEQIIQAKEENDSIGGTVFCIVKNCPLGLGEPCFDKMEAKLAHAMLSIPSTKGFEIGSGFKGTQIRGSKHNDPWAKKEILLSDKEVKQGTGAELYKKHLTTKKNNSGGVQGGITNGQTVYFRVAFKPPATICQEQKTTGYNGEEGILKARGRHDPCVVPRAVPIVEAMTSLVIMDSLMAQLARKNGAMNLPETEVHPSLKGAQ